MDAGADQRGVTARPALVYALLLAGAFVVYASANAVVPVAAELRRALDLGEGGAGILLGPFAIGFGVGCFLWFAVARHHAPRALLPLALALAAAGSLPLVLTGDVTVAVGARFVTGLGAAGYPAAAQAVIAAAAPERARGRMIAGFAMAVVAGSFVGQAIVGALADLTTVDVALTAVCVAAPVILAVALRRVLPAGVAAPAGTAHAKVGALLARQWPVLAVAFLAFMGYWLLLGELPVILREDRYALSAAEAGAVPMVGLLGIAAAYLAGRASDRRGQRLPMVTTLLVGAGALAITLVASAPVWVFAAAYGVFLAGYWGYLPPASAEAVARAQGPDRQAGLMAFYAAMWAGAAIAPALAALVPGWSASVAVVLLSWGAAVAVAATTFHHRPGVSAGAPRGDEGREEVGDAR